jgi:hypothetical protein
MNLSKNVKITPVLAYSADISGGAGTANSTEVDMRDFEGVMFVGGAIGTANAGNYYKVQQAPATGMSGAADLTGTKLVPGDNGDSICLDVYRPQERFVHIVRVGGAASTGGAVYAIQYGPKKAPTTHATTVDTETHISPAEGTA